MRLERNETAFYAATFIFFAGVSGSGLLVPRHLGTTLLFAYFTAFFGYFWLVSSTLNFKEVILIGMAARILLFLQMPTLSDDIYRFVWDGYLVGHGLSPYTHLPVTLINAEIPGISSSLYNQLNSQNYYSVYPPLNQAIFWLSTVWTDEVLMQTNTIRTILLAADIGSFWLLYKIMGTNNSKAAYWFFLNPLLILEAVGNVHFEGLVVLFLLLGIYAFEKNKSGLSGMGFGLAIATKLLPLIYLPAIFFKSWKGKGMRISLITGLVAVLSLLPFLFCGALTGMTASLGLYFQKFEFNASIYFVLREIGFWIKGYNIIASLGPWLSLASLLGIIGLSLLGKVRNWPIAQTLLFILTLYFCLATTVHPWYILPLVALGLLSGFYYPLVWSFLIFLTYLGYTDTGFELNSWWLVFEYTLVFIVMIFELYKKYEARTL